jgi:hypothetical protein
MRTVTNTLMFLVALLTVVGIYVLREQSAGGLQRTFGALLGNQRAVARRRPPAPPKVGAAKRIHSQAVGGTSLIPQVEVTVTVIPVEPRPPVDAIHVGMAKSRLWKDFGTPNATTSSRDGERFLETFIYLFEDPSSATVIRLIDGAVVSVRTTRTVSPPLLVPQSSRLRTPVSLQSDAM